MLKKLTSTMERQHGISNERKIQAISRVSCAVNLAIERFITVGEIIAEDNPEIKSDMYESFKDARDAGKSIERLCQITNVDAIDYLDPMSVPLPCDQSAIILAARSLISSITRVLLLVDIVVVKQLLSTSKKITRSLIKMESVMNFTEFVRAFSVFGKEMVELAYLTGNHQNVLKEERRRAQINSARLILERSIVILVTSSKTCLVHGDCTIAKENRDTVFCQIRRAMDLIHFIVKDSIFESSWLSCQNNKPKCYRNADRETIFSTLKTFTHLMESFRHRTKQQSSNAEKSRYMDEMGRNCLHTEMGSDSERKLYSGTNFANSWYDVDVALPSYNSKIREQLLNVFERLLEQTYDFTDSAYTSQENRENILYLCERCKSELQKYLNNIIDCNESYSPAQLIDKEIDSVLNAVEKLSEQLVLSATDQVIDLYHSLEMSVNLVNNFHTFAINQDLDRLQERSNRFHEYCDHIIDVCKLLQHIAFNETLQVQTKTLTINLRIYGPQVLIAAKVLSKYPQSTPANENFDAFVEMWKWLICEITTMVKQIMETSSIFNSVNAENLNLPERYKERSTTGLAAAVGPTIAALAANKSLSDNCTSNQFTQRLSEKNIPPTSTITPSSQQITSSTGIPLNDDKIKDVTNNQMSLQCNNDKWNDELVTDNNNDIIKRAKNMSAMAFSMYQFTKGNGTLRTTQDLFTQAEYFAEEANRLYKVLRQFSYQVPASQNKKDLLSILDRVPTFVQTLQFTVKDHTVGRAATFMKVDHVIRETKNLMSVINKVVTECFECANKYKLDFTGLSGGITSGSLRGDDCNASGMGDSKGTTSSTEGSM